MRQAFGPGWALVGDAGYFKDPLTAHGISDALRDAELLANAAAGGTTAHFEDTLRHATRCRCRCSRSVMRLPRWTGISTSSARCTKP